MPTVASPPNSCYTEDMIGYRLVCRRETHFALEIEDRIKNMLHQQEINDPNEGGMNSCVLPSLVVDIS